MTAGVSKDYDAFTSKSQVVQEPLTYLHCHIYDNLNLWQHHSEKPESCNLASLSNKYSTPQTQTHITHRTLQLDNGYIYFHNKLNMSFITTCHTKTMNNNSGSKHIKHKNETVQQHNTTDVFNLRVT